MRKWNGIIKNKALSDVLPGSGVSADKGNREPAEKWKRALQITGPRGTLARLTDQCEVELPTVSRRVANLHFTLVGPQIFGF